MAKTFKDLLAQVKTVLTAADISGVDPRVVDIQVNTQGADAEGNVGDSWATVEAGVTCIFLEKHEGAPITIESFGKLTGKVTRVVSFDTRHDLTPRHRLVYVDSGGTTHYYQVLGTVDTGELDAEWLVYVYEVYA